MLPNKSVLFFGDVGQYLSSEARRQFNDAVLIDHKNYRQFLKSKSLPPASYTSLGDLPKEIKTVYQLLDLADEIIYLPPTVWSDQRSVDIYDPSTSTKGFSDLIMLDFLTIKNNVQRLDLSAYHNSSMLDLADQRRSDNPQLWMVGCSFTHGVGVESHQRYGQLLADHLDLPVSFLTAPGSSVEWSVDQILRSDIRKGDLVVWGMTVQHRISWWNSTENRLQHLNPFNIESKVYKIDVPSESLIDVIDSNCMVYKSVVSAAQVSNYCNKIGARLLIVGLLCTDAVNLQLRCRQEFVPFYYLKHLPKYLDLGSDKRHPGPKQHQHYYHVCLTALEQRKII